jgi:hypothetical protein
VLCQAGGKTHAPFAPVESQKCPQFAEKSDFHVALRERLDALLAFPDGEPFAPLPRWRALGERAGALAAELRGMALDEPAARARLDELREGWRQLHDRWADLQSGLLTFIARRFGEAAIGDCCRAVLEPFLRERYGPYDIRERPYEETVERNLYLALEAMRAHLVGPTAWATWS